MMGVGKILPTTGFGCVSISTKTKTKTKTKSPNISRSPLLINPSIISPISLLPSSSRWCRSDLRLHHLQKHQTASLCHYNTKISSIFQKMATPVVAKIAPSMLSSDFANLAAEAERMVSFGADWLHMDIMDGHFVPNLTIGAPVIASLRKHTKAYLDCHLMVTNPLDYVNDFGKAGASGFTFHVEVSKDNWQELVKEIKSKGMRPGVALKPGTPIEEVYPLVEGENCVEMVLVMTVEPGFGGQKFMPDMMNKVRTLREKYPTLDIEVDGGLGPSTIEAAAAAGANCIVAGSSVFGAPEPAQVISLLRTAVNNAHLNH